MDGWNQKKWVHSWRKKKIKTWQLLLLCALLSLSSAYALRQNNLMMVRLRDQVLVADKSGTGVSTALENLNSYVFHHMNTKIVHPIELVNTYNLQAKAVIEASNQTSGKDIYTEATAACEHRGIPLTSIAQCIADYAADHNTLTGPSTIKLPDKNRFIYSFASPIWTPDVAGMLLLITGVVILWIVLRLVEYMVVRLILRHRLKGGF